MSEPRQIEVKSASVVCAAEGVMLYEMCPTSRLDILTSGPHLVPQTLHLSSQALDVASVLRSQLREFAQPPAELVAYGTDCHSRRYTSILLVTFSITNTCRFLLHVQFFPKVHCWQNNSHTVKRQMQAATQTFGCRFCYGSQSREAP